MAEKPREGQDDELSRLRARVSELEAELQKKTTETRRSAREESRREAADAFSDVSRQKIDTVNRIVRGFTLASVEGVRLFADSVATFADTVSSRNTAKENASVRDLSTRLPGDIAAGFADAVEHFADAPARMADRYSQAHKEGEKSYKSTRSESA